MVSGEPHPNTHTTLVGGQIGVGVDGWKRKMIQYSERKATHNSPVHSPKVLRVIAGALVARKRTARIDGPHVVAQVTWGKENENERGRKWDGAQMVAR